VGQVPLLTIGHISLAFVLSVHILLHKHRPVSAVLWLAAVWAVPIAGALGYGAFGVDRVRRHASERAIVQRALYHGPSSLLAVEWSGSTEEDPLNAHPAEHILRTTDPAVRAHRVLPGNRAELLVDGDEFYPVLFDALEGAESSINLQTYIFAIDRTGKRLRDLLMRKAAEGVQVRVLYDRFGSTFAHVTGFFRSAKKNGVRVGSISQAHPLKGRFQINLRNHRKVVVIDGRSGFLGGMNFDDRNLSVPGRIGPDRDYQVRLAGPAVMELQDAFVADWYFATREDPETFRSEAFFPTLLPVGNGLVQMVPGAPERGGRGLAHAYFAALVSARESVDIVTAYFVPDETILEALRYAAFRGVRVRLVLPAKSNHWYTSYAARSLYGPLLQAGVRIFEREPPFMHAKALVVDGVYAMMGSANLDYRSLQLNYELNVEIADPPFLERLTEQVESEIAVSCEITLAHHAARPVVRRLTENLCFLFQPML
jgi:cardiolipin synthase